MDRSANRTEPLAMVANTSGIASFVLAVGGDNVEKLSLFSAGDRSAARSVAKAANAVIGGRNGSDAEIGHQKVILEQRKLPMNAIISPCGTYRYRLERDISMDGIVYAYFGVNGSTATATEDDHTVTKWIGFTGRTGGKRFIVGNAFAYRATNVAALNSADDPVGPDNDAHLDQIIRDADILVPCWGSRTKIPMRLRARLDVLRNRLFASGKPVKVWGFTKSGDPLHPLTLGYATPLVDWIL